jgi:PEP phosphonomutase and related enzymes
MNFAELHQQKTPLLIANVWDAASAKTAQQLGYQALGTSSAAIAAMLGYEDGEAMSFDELFYIVTRIKAVTSLPISIDIEAGFGGSVSVVAARLKRLAQLGVVGINLEDSRAIDGVRRLEDATDFAIRLQAIREALKDEAHPLFFNIRTDAFLINHALALRETLLRARLYEAAGADGIFVPCLTSEKEIASVARATDLPLNVMCMPGLPAFDRLAELGVHRISMGNFVHSAMQSALKAMMQSILLQQTFAGVFVDESAR